MCSNGRQASARRAGAATGAAERPPPSRPLPAAGAASSLSATRRSLNRWADPGRAPAPGTHPARPHARGETVTTHFEDIIRQNSQRLADLKKTTEDLQRELSEARVSLERQRTQSLHGHDLLQEQLPDLYLGRPEESPTGPTPDAIPGHYPANSQVYYSADEPPFVGEGPRYEAGAQAESADVPDPTVGIVNHGRQSAYRRGFSQRPRSRSRRPRSSWPPCSPSSSAVAGRPGRPVWPRSRRRSPRPARTPTWSPSPAGQLRLREGHPAGPLGLLPADQRQQSPVRGHQDRPAGPGAHYACPGRGGRRLAEPASSLRPRRPHRQHRGGRPRHQRHHRRGHPDRN